MRDKVLRPEHLIRTPMRLALVLSVLLSVALSAFFLADGASGESDGVHRVLTSQSHSQVERDCEAVGVHQCHVSAVGNLVAALAAPPWPPAGSSDIGRVNDARSAPTLVTFRHFRPPNGHVRT